MAEPDSSTPLDTTELYMLTTVDNPYNPFTEWDDWYSFDMSKGYHTPGLIARLTFDSEELSDADQTLAVQLAIREIAQENALGLYRLVSEENFLPGSPLPDSV